MKANEAPENVYLAINVFGDIIKDQWQFHRLRDDDIEYTRTDAFIEKAWNWIEDNMLTPNQKDKSLVYFEQFKKYMKEE